ncbi:MAG: hypothetical protein ACTS6H_02165 [Candidatus Hodgkinia cicadicola]
MWRKLLAKRSLFNEIVCFAGWRPWKIYRGANWLKGTFVSKKRTKVRGEAQFSAFEGVNRSIG